MGNTKLIQFSGVVRAELLFTHPGRMTWHPNKGPLTLKQHVRADELAVSYRELTDLDREHDKEAITPKHSLWTHGCYETNSLHDCVDVLVEYFLWHGYVARIDLDWSDVRYFQVERGVLMDPTIWGPRPQKGPVLYFVNREHGCNVRAAGERSGPCPATPAWSYREAGDVRRQLCERHADQFRLIRPGLFEQDPPEGYGAKRL